MVEAGTDNLTGPGHDDRNCEEDHRKREPGLRPGCLQAGEEDHICARPVDGDRVTEDEAHQPEQRDQRVVRPSRPVLASQQEPEADAEEGAEKHEVREEAQMDDVGAGPSDQRQFEEQHERAAQNQPCPITHLVSFQFDAWCVRHLVWPVANVVSPVATQTWRNSAYEVLAAPHPCVRERSVPRAAPSTIDHDADTAAHAARRHGIASSRPPADEPGMPGAASDIAGRSTYSCCRDPGGASQLGSPTPRARSDGPRIRRATRRPGAGPHCADVARPFLPAVPSGLRRDPVLIPDDPAYRTREGAAAARRHVGDRRVHGGWMYLARFVQFPVYRARGRDADCISFPRPRWSSRRPCLRCEDAHPTEQERRSETHGSHLASSPWISHSSTASST